MAKPKRPRDPNQLAKLIVDIATGNHPNTPTDERKLATTESRRKGGLKGGKSRAEALTPDQRTAIASVAANARWKRRK
jgi:hypothetical protein